MRLLAACAILLTAASMAQGQKASKSAAGAADARQQVLAAEDARAEALQKGDVQALDRLYVDDLVYTNALGLTLTKAQHLADIRNRKLSFQSFHHSDVEVRVHGTTGIVTGISTSQVAYAGKVNGSPRKFLDVFVKEGGAWRCAIHFETYVEQPKAQQASAR